MPPDITGPTGVDRLLQPPTRHTGVGGVSSSQAVVRVAPVDPQSRTDVPSQLLGRSGLDLYELLATSDLVITRATTGNVALDVGLEQARSALLRNLPGDALAALDGIWDAARHTEEGWYLRSGALLVLGLPGESDRVANDGSVVAPQSSALRFIQSLARLMVNDSVGARTAIEEALQRAPQDATLLIQQALVQAKQGDRQPALRVLAEMQHAMPDHPALVWGRAALKVIVADMTRQQFRRTPMNSPVVPDVTADDRVPSVTPRRMADVATAALERFGASIAARPMPEVGREARLLLRAFSAGGTLVTSVTAEQAHAARGILSAVVHWASGEARAAQSPVHAVVMQLVALIQGGHFDEAQRFLRRQGGVAREPVGRLLLAVLLGADQSSPPDGATAWSRVSSTPGHGTAWATESLTPGGSVGVVREDRDRGAVVPIRLGLAMLASGIPGDTLSQINNEIINGTSYENLSVIERLSGRVARIPNPEERGEGWGAAGAAAALQSTSDWSAGAGMRAVALVCVVMAAGFLIAGYSVPAIALAVGAAWLGLRRSGRELSGRLNENVYQSANEPEKSPESGIRR